MRCTPAYSLMFNNTNPLVKNPTGMYASQDRFYRRGRPLPADARQAGQPRAGHRAAQLGGQTHPVGDANRIRKWLKS